MPFYWDTPTSYTDYLTSGLNSLAAGTTVTGATITPGTTYSNLRFYAGFALVLATFSPNSTTSFDLFILPAADNTPTNFAGPESMAPVWTFTIGTGTSVARYAATPPLPVPPIPWRAALRSNTGSTTLASASNILRYYITTET